jgi:hypothetical protein
MVARYAFWGLIGGATFASAMLLSACNGGGGNDSQSTDDAGSGGITAPTGEGSVPTGSLDTGDTTATGGSGVVTGGGPGSDSSGGTGPSPSTDTGTSGDTGDPDTGNAEVSSGDVTGDTGDPPEGFDVQPSAMQEIAVGIYEQTPTIMYTATLNGQPVGAGWGVDRGEVGSVMAGPNATTTFKPTGTAGGLVHVYAGLNMESVSRDIFVKLSGEQNGYDPDNPTDDPQVPEGAGVLLEGGGVGGVGGEGIGPPVMDPLIFDAFASPVDDGSSIGLKYLYPYDGTVWPRGMLAPLLMWRSTLGDADAVQIELSTTTDSFAWKGTFAAPEVLMQTGGPFIRHPIPQSVWNMATNSAGGSDLLTVKLTIAKDGQAYGPIEQTWKIAPARLSGVIYYNSYGTKLAQNYGGAIGGNGMFGGAVLSIRAGDTGPKLTAGANGNSSQCRVCHSVSADGSRLIAQRGDNTSQSVLYDLFPDNVIATPLATGAEFPGMYHDGSMALAPSGQLLPLPDNAVPLPATGLTSFSTNIGTPTFAPDGSLVAFNPMTSPQLQNPRQKLVVMSFDAGSLTFSDPVVVADYTGSPAEHRPGWPAFFPDGKSVVFHEQIAAGVDGNNLGDLRTRKGARAFLSMANVGDPMTVTPLNQLNGKDADNNSYLPALDQPVVMGCTGDGAQVGNIDNTHANDVDLNYEPTVNPIASGGYAWVVFTSRRLYGNVATIPPFCSDPRGVDLFQNITTKKLWVAAIDLDAEPGTDASHPAFYLPAQELLAGNSRGFWVLNPCKPSGEGCSAGDECCGGYCQPETDGGPLICLDDLPEGQCAQPSEKCDVDADCCDNHNVCLNGFCTVPSPG